VKGHAGYVRAGRAAGLWRYNAFVSWRSPGVDFNDLGYLQTADFVAPGAQLQYYNATAGSWLRRRDLRLKFTAPSDFGGEPLGRNLYLESEFTTMSGAYSWSRLGVETAVLDTHVLRGGPALRVANRFPVSFYAETNGGRPWQLRFNGTATTTTERDSLYLKGAPELVWKWGGRWKISAMVDYERNREATHFAGAASGAASPVYVMGRLDQHVLYSTLKLCLNFTPTLSLSYFGGPFVTTGRYSDFRAVAQPRATDPGARFASLTMQSAADGTRSTRYQGSDLTLANPDFNWREFKSNLVLRWEYRPGSFVYCVWSQFRSDEASLGGFAPVSQYNRLFSTRPDDTFLIKASYWFSL
jgi:hypothetical protein